MESVEIDRVLQGTPVFEHKSLFDQPLMPKAPLPAPEEQEEHLNHHSLISRKIVVFYAQDQRGVKEWRYFGLKEPVIIR